MDDSLTLGHLYERAFDGWLPASTRIYVADGAGGFFPIVGMLVNRVNSIQSRIELTVGEEFRKESLMPHLDFSGYEPTEEEIAEFRARVDRARRFGPA
jgi:hypothetical protein